MAPGLRGAALLAGSLLVGVLAASEAVQWAASHCLLGSGANPGGRPGAHGAEAVVVLGHADAGTVAGAENRRRVRAGLRSLATPESVLVLSGGAVAGPVPEAELMADYATGVLGYSGPLVLEVSSRSTWENIGAIIPLVENASRIVVVSDPVHALKARMFLRRREPELAARLARADDYRTGEDLLRKPLRTVAGLVDLGLSAWVPWWAAESASGLAGARRLLAGGQGSVLRKRLRRVRPSVISSREAAYDRRTWDSAVRTPKSRPGVSATCASSSACMQKSQDDRPVSDTSK